MPTPNNQIKNEISDDDGISSDSERSVASAKRSKTGPKRVKPQCYGPSSAFWHKGAQSNPTAHTCGELGTLPVKIDEPVRHNADLTRGVSRLRRYFTRPHNRLPLMVDDELTAYLQCEFAFRPRTPELLPQMAGKARQFLAKFNIDTRQSESFIGVPTPLNTIFFTFFPLIMWMKFDTWRYDEGIFAYLFNSYFLVGLCVFMSLLLVSELKLFSLKFKHFKWKGNEIRFSFLLISMILIPTLLKEVIVHSFSD